MTGKSLLKRWAYLTIFVVCAGAGLKLWLESAEAIAERLVPAYVPMSAEDVFKAAELPCNRPPGAASGCLNAQPPNSTDSMYVQIQGRSQFIVESLSLRAVNLRHQRDYKDRVIAPKAKSLVIGGQVSFGFLYVAAALYLILLLKDTFVVLRRVVVLPPVFTGRGRAGSWTLSRAQREFATLKSLYDNGLITEAAFLKRKQDLVARLGKLE